MPELPEVEVVRRGLADHVVGRTIAAVEFRGAPRRPSTPRPARRTSPPGSRATTSTRAPARGKYLWLVLERPTVTQALLAHLGMSGQLLVEAADAPDEKHLHARFGFADGGPELRFVDQRTFGGLALAELDDDAASRETIAHIAPDPFEATYDQAAVVRRIKARDSRGQAGAARPDPRSRDRQHLRRRGPVAGAGAR